MALRPPAGPPRPQEARRRDPSPLPPAGAAVLRGSPSAASVVSNRDHVWEVLHQREQAADDARRPAAGEALHPREAAPRVATPPPGRKRQGDRPGSPARLLSLPPPVSSPGWAVPNPQAAAYEWHLEVPQALPPRRFRSVDPDPGLGSSYVDLTGWVERRLESVQADYRAELSSRLSSLELSERRFKEWVQAENEQLTGGLQQVKSTLDGQVQNQRHLASLQGQCQKLELRLQEMEVSVAQTATQAQSMVQNQMVQAMGAAVGGGTGGTGAAPQQAAVDALRMGLEREVAARTELSVEATEKIKELHRMLAEVSDRHHQDLQNQALQQSGADLQQQAKLAGLAPAMESMRAEIESVREQLRRNMSDCARRCEEVDSSCARRSSSVQEAAMSSAKELWDEHVGVVAECKAALASLQQIMESKDKILQQLQHLQKQQREDDKQELATRQQQAVEGLRNRLRDVEVAFTSERNLRQEVQQATDTQINRVGVALEKAQSEWIKESSRLSDVFKEIKEHMGATLDGEARGWERRLAEAVDGITRRLEDLETKATAVKASVANLDDRVIDIARTHEADLGEVETRLKRDLTDLESVQTGKISQCEFDLRNGVQKALGRYQEQVRAEFMRLEDNATLERSVLRASIDDLTQSTETKIGNLYEGIQQQIGDVQQAFEARASAVAGEVEVLRAETQKEDNEVRAYAERLKKETVATCLDAVSAARHEASQQASQSEQRCKELSADLLDAQARLAEQIQEVEESFTSRLDEELKKEHDRMHEEAKQMVDEERHDRLQAESERSVALQQRLAAFEDAVSSRLDHWKAHQEEAMTTHRQSIQAELAQDRQEVRSYVEEIQREQAESAQAAQAKLEKLNVAFDGLASECSETLERTVEDVEKSQKALEGRVLKELAASAAKVAVTTTTLVAQLSTGLADVDRKIERSELASAAERASLRSDIETRLGNIASGTAESIEGIEAKVEAQGATLTENMQLVRSDVELALQGHKDVIKCDLIEQEEKMDAMQEQQQQTVEAMLKSLDKATANIEEALEAKSAEIREHVQTSLQSAATTWLQQFDELRGDLEEKIKEVAQLEEARALAAEGELEKAFKNFDNNFDEKLEGLRKEGDTNLKTARDTLEEMLGSEVARSMREEVELKRKMKEHMDRLEELVKEQAQSKEVESALREDVESLQVANTESKKNMEALQVAQVELKRNVEAQEAVQASSQSALQAQLQELTRQQRKREVEGVNDLQAQLQSIRAEQTESLQAEVTRSTAAEEHLRRRLEEHEQATQEARKKLHELSGVQEKLKQQIDTVKSSQERVSSEAAAVAASEAEAAARGDEQAASMLRESQEALAREEAERAKLEDELSGLAAKQVALQEVVDALKHDRDREKEQEKLREQEQEREKEKEKAALESEAAAREVKQEEARTASKQEQQKLDDRLQTMEKMQGESVEKQSAAQAEFSEKLTAVKQEVEGLSSSMNLNDTALQNLRLRVDGGFAALNTKLECAHWLQAQMEDAADKIGKDYLRFLEQRCLYMEKTLQQLEDQGVIVRGPSA